MDLPILHLVNELNPALLLYLAAGMLTLLIAVGTHLWDHRHSWRKPKLLTSLVAEKSPQPKQLWYGIRAWAIAPILTAVATVLLWPLAWWMKGGDLLAQRREGRIFKVQSQHLLERLTVLEIEAREAVYDPLSAVPDLPFGHLNAVWTGLKATMRPKDEVWTFAANWPDNFGMPQVRRGYVLWRQRRPVGYILVNNSTRLKGK